MSILTNLSDDPDANLFYLLQRSQLIAPLLAAGSNTVVIASPGLAERLKGADTKSKTRILTLSQALDKTVQGSPSIVLLNPAISVRQRSQIRQAAPAARIYDGLLDLGVEQVFADQTLLPPGKDPAGPEAGSDLPPLLIVGNGGLEMDFFAVQLAEAGIARPRRYFDDFHLQWYQMGGRFSLMRLLSRSADAAARRGDNRFAVTLPFRLLLAGEQAGLIKRDDWVDFLNEQRIPVIYYNNRDKISRALYARQTPDVLPSRRWQQLLKSGAPASTDTPPFDAIFSDIIRDIEQDQQGRDAIEDIENLLMITHEEFLLEPDRFAQRVADFLNQKDFKQPRTTWADLQDRHFAHVPGQARELLEQMIDYLGLFVTAEGSLVNFEGLLRWQKEQEARDRARSSADQS